MAFDKEEFRRRAAEKAKAQLQEKKKLAENAPVVGVGPNQAENSYIESPLTKEELKVVEAYRKWKVTRVQEEAGDDGATAPAPNATEMTESKEERVERLKRKIERRKRVESLKAKLAEKRASEQPDQIKDQAKALKERIQKVRTQLKSLKEEGDLGMPSAPMAPLAGAASAPMGAAAPGAEGMPGAIPNLPPEITAEIQNIATAAQSLAQMAGVAPAAPQPGADLNAGIPPETGDTSGAGMLPESVAKEERIARIRSLLEAKKAEKDKKDKDEKKDKDGKKAAPFGKKKEAAVCPNCGKEPCECSEDEKLIEQTRARAAQRREALAKIRAKAMNEKSYEAEEKGSADAQDYIKSAMDSGGALGDKGYEFLKQNALQSAGVKHEGSSPSMPGRAEATRSIAPAKVWPAKDLNYGGKVPDKMPSTPDVNPVKKGSGQPMKNAGTNNYGAVTESADDAWDQKHIDHFLERKELNFAQLLKEGRLG